MLESYLVGIGSIVAISLAWLAVQTAWARVFAGEAKDPDPLAGRSCHGCGCTTVCERQAGAALTQENPQ